jgi:NADH-quinone oxidoreductase subunit N
MTLETLLFKEINIFPELFLGISIVYLTLHSTFISINKHYILIQNSLISLGVLILLLVCYLLLNNQLDLLNLTNFNNTIVNDYLSFSSKLIICFLSLSCLLMIQQYLADQKLNHFEYVLLLLFSILGLFILISSNDLLTAYLAIELQSLSFYVLAAFKKNSTFSIESGIKYFILGSFSSCLFLLGSSLLYGLTGTINFEDFKDLFFWFFQSNNSSDTLNFDVTLILVAIVFILISLFFKLAIAPFHVWAPDVYEGSPSASTFFFSVVPKLSIFVLLFRLFYFSFYSFLDYWRYFVVLFILFTIIVGSFGGLEQRKLKSLLVYSSISHMGYSLIAFTTGTFEGIQILFCYLIIYSFSGLCVWSIFMLTRLKNNYKNKQNKDLTDLVLLGKSNKMLAIFFTTVLFSIAGFPPMIGFIVKISIFLSAIEASMYFVALLSILGSVIATFYYIRIIKILFFEKLLIGKLYYPINNSKSIFVVLLFFLFLFLFANPTLLFLFSYKLALLSLPI